MNARTLTRTAAIVFFGPFLIHEQQQWNNDKKIVRFGRVFEAKGTINKFPY